MSFFPEMPATPSPRLQWMQAKKIHTRQGKDGKWIAYKSATQHHYDHAVEIDAIVGLAKKLKIKLWNE